jgi:hemerythrin superfamily protein
LATAPRLARGLLLVAAMATIHRSDDIRDLMVEDHAHLERLFDAVVGEARCDDPPALRAQWGRFEKELSDHLTLEESQILPAFSKEYPAEARAILEEHGRIRSILTELGVELELHCLRSERVSTFIDYLREHARREEKLLYPWASRQEQAGVLGSLRSILTNLVSRRAHVDATGADQGRVVGG